MAQYASASSSQTQVTFLVLCAMKEENVFPELDFLQKVENIKREAKQELAHETKTVGVLSVQSTRQAVEEAVSEANPRQLFHSFWFENEICCLYADSNVGKSILAYQIAIEIAKMQRVVYFDFELSKKQLQMRYTDDGGRTFDFPENLLRSELNADQLANSDVPFEDAVVNSTCEVALSCNANVLIIDNISILCSQAERSDDAAVLVRRLRTMKNQYGFSILAIAHTPKRNMSMKINQNDLAGSKKLMNFIDSAFAVGKSAQGSDLRYLKQVKVRNCEEEYGENHVLVCRIEKVGAMLQFTEIGTSYESEHLKEKDKEADIATAHQLKDEGLSLRKIADKMGVSKSTAGRLLQKTVPKDGVGQLGQPSHVSQASQPNLGTVGEENMETNNSQGYEGISLFP